MSWIGEKLGAKAAMRMSAPRARKEGLVIEDVADEVLIYDQTSDKVHCLTREAAMVWRVCDGSTSPTELASALGLSQETVSAALDHLQEADLLEAPPSIGITRREATVRMAKVGGAAAAAPMIYSILAPTPALASSQAYCLAFGCVTTQGCGACHNCGCACCGPGNKNKKDTDLTGENKLCTADCSTINCTADLINSHCNVDIGTAPSCNQSNGTGTCQLTK